MQRSCTAVSECAPTKRRRNGDDRGSGDAHVAATGAGEIVSAPRRRIAALPASARHGELAQQRLQFTLMCAATRASSRSPLGSRWISTTLLLALA